MARFDVREKFDSDGKSEGWFIYDWNDPRPTCYATKSEADEELQRLEKVLEEKAKSDRGR